jgi:two pore calcium channel protein|mmetsp:Transcript_17599/g.20782  ORF Transcript_17599/g.20782 Transcript_17599/m.20782 type:complete len:200 (+) Transcript_17599:656-1255(+)
MIDLGFALWMNNRPILSAYVRPLVVGTFMKSISENFFTLCKDLRDASVVLAMIFTFLAAYSLICFFFYQGSYGGFINFSSMTEAYYRLLILLTTANFPDIMLPAYEQNFWNCLLFISFLVVGLYFLMNVLLANVYSKFKVRLQSDGVQNMIDQERYLNEYLDRFDLDNNGIMEPGESKSFYEEIFNFDVRQSRVDYDTL